MLDGTCLRLPCLMYSTLLMQVVSLFFDADYYTTLRAGTQRPTAWQASSAAGTLPPLIQLTCICLAASPAGVPDRLVRPFLCFLLTCLLP
jgi:hypothetical protein